MTYIRGRVVVVMSKFAEAFDLSWSDTKNIEGKPIVGRCSQSFLLHKAEQITKGSEL